MKVLMLTGSPHIKGTAAVLADTFCEGAKAARIEGASWPDQARESGASLR